MKKIILIALFCLVTAGLAWAQDYPTPLMEQVNINPKVYVGLTVKFMEGELEPNPYSFDGYKTYFNYSERIFFYYVYSKDRNSFYVPYPSDYEIAFYTSQSLASIIVGSGLDINTMYKFNLICQVEMIIGLNYYSREEPYYLCRILGLELLDTLGNVVATYYDNGTLPVSPLEKWDIGLDGKIGLPEAIRALQVVAGIRLE
jgi:hypothetical protein